MQIALTGIKPSGHPHIGNYLGMIRPALDLTRDYRCLFFIADYHALTTLHNGKELRENTDAIAATWLAFGLDPEQTLLYRQSDVPEIMELSWILACFTAKGMLDRAHAYKDAVAQQREISAGLYTYPVLMAADILAFGSNVVPVGRDQKQHVEIARDIAIRFNNTYGDLLVVPEPLIREEVETIPGLDGRKMSKSYGNTIPLFLDSKPLRKLVMQIQTDSTPVEAPKDAASSTIFQLYCFFAQPGEVASLRQQLEAGGTGWAVAKEALFEAMEAYFAESRERYRSLIADRARLHATLEEGAKHARHLVQKRMEKIRRAIGVR